METVKVGKKAKELVTEVTCNNCGTVFSYFPTDIEYPMFYTGIENKITSYVRCPICSSRYSLGVTIY